MNKFWQFIITIRNFSYHWQLIIKTRDLCQQIAIKHYGVEGAGSEYKLNFFAFILGHVITVVFIVFQVILFFYDGSVLPLNQTDPWYVKLLAGAILFVLLSHLITRFLLRKIEHIPLPTIYNPKEYRRFIGVFWALFLLGWVLWITIGIFLMSHLRGIDIQ